MPASSSTYVQHALWNYTSRALREQKTKQLTARGPGNTVCTASLHKSAEPAYCTAGARAWPTLDARGRAVWRTRTCQNIRQLMLKCANTHERAQVGLGLEICVIILSIYGAREGRGRIVIKQSKFKCRTKIKESQIPLGITPYHHNPIPPRN